MVSPLAFQSPLRHPAGCRASKPRCRRRSELNWVLSMWSTLHEYTPSTGGRLISALSTKPGPGTQAVEWQLNRWERVWEEDSNEDVPLMRLAMSWLRRNNPETDHISVVHGDYRVGNFLFTESDRKITAWLDWELSYLGDHHEDLAWTTKDIFGHADEEGKHFLVGGFIPKEEFWRRIRRLPDSR